MLFGHKKPTGNAYMFTAKLTKFIITRIDKLLINKKFAKIFDKTLRTFCKTQLK